MYIVDPCTLDVIVTALGTRIYTAWAQPVAYAQGARVSYQRPSDSVWHDYECRWAHTSSATITPTTYYYWWIDLGPSTTSASTYDANIAQSFFPIWVTATSAALGSAVHDEADHHDYQAVMAIASGDNTVRPSAAVGSSDDAIAARWADLGPANLWRLIDGEADSAAQSINSSAAIVSPMTFGLQVPAGVAIDTVVLMALENVATATLTVDTEDPVAKSLSYSTKSHLTRRSAVWAIDEVTAPELQFSLAAKTSGVAMGVGLVLAGLREDLAITDLECAIELIDYSRKERDPTFGTVSFLQRGFSRQIQAALHYHTASVEGDAVMRVLSMVRGRPVFFDFNEASTDHERLRIYGFYSSARPIIESEALEGMAIVVEGLVE